MPDISKSYLKTPNLQSYPQSQSRTALDKKSGGDSRALCKAPPETILDASKEVTCRAQEEGKGGAIIENNRQSDVEASWQVARDALLESRPVINAPWYSPYARIRPGVTMLSIPDVYKRRKKGRSAHYADIQSGLFIEPVAIGSRSRATPDYEVDILIAADIAGKSDEEKRALVRELRAARKGVL